MSEAVFFYQLSILASVVGVGIVVGEKSMVWVAIAWSVWTLVMLFTGWLFILQFGTIAVASFSGFAIQESARYPAIQSFSRKALLGLGVLAATGIAVGLYVDNTRQRDYVAPVSTPSPGSPPMSTQPGLAFKPAVDPVISIPTPEPKPDKVYVCSEKRSGQTRATYQDFPCGSSWSDRRS